MRGERLKYRVRGSRRFVVTILIVCFVLSAVATAQDAAAPSEPIDHWAGIEVAEAISQSTGIAISPLLGVGALGAWTYFRVPEAQRHQLPWFAQLWFWLPALLLVALLVAKDPLLGFLPIVKKPLDALDVVEDKISAVLAGAVVIPMLISVLSRALFGGEVAGLSAGGPFLMAIALPAFLTGAPAKILIALAVVGSMAAFFFTWLAAHTINVLILLSPFGPLDTLLRAVKGLTLMALVITTVFAPVLGLLVSLLIVMVAWKVSGWSFRFTVFGSVLAWDILSFGHRRVAATTERIKAFSGPRLAEIAPRTYGELERRGQSQPVFAHRPWLVLPINRVPIPAGELEIGKELLSPVLMEASDREGGSRHFVRFPPRFTGHEEDLAERFGARRVRLLGVRRHLGDLGDWLRGAFDGSRKTIKPGIS